MKKILLSLFITLFCLNGFCATFNVTNVGVTFSPATITITQNDDVLFTLGVIHDAVEVDLATWTANGISPIIGFSVPFGGGTLLGSQLSVGTHYYVCENHAFLGMKGTIIVQSTSAVPVVKTQNDMLIYPNPAKDKITLQFNNPTLNPVEITLFDFQGKLVEVLFPKTEFTGLLVRTFSLSKINGGGIYIVKITSGDQVAYQKIVVN
jgi:plastocyanin